MGCKMCTRHAAKPSGVIFSTTNKDRNNRGLRKECM
eukprot:jgi/Antlo1/10/2029